MIADWVRNPARIWPLLLCVHLLAVLGVMRLEVDDGLIRTFESDLPRYHDYTGFLDRFQSDGRDVLILLEGPDMADPAVLDAVAGFLLELQLMEGVAGVVSPFSLRSETTAEGGMLIPDPPPPRAEMQALLKAERAASRDLARLLSEDRKLMLLLVPLGDAAEDMDARGRILFQVDRLLDDTVRQAGLQATLTGYPVLRDRISGAIFRDLLVLNAVGAILGLAVGAASLRSLRLGLLTILAPLTALLWVLGMLGWLGIQINVITVALPVLVLALATADAIHLSLELARLRHQRSPDAELLAVRRIAPACLLAALTTAVAFGGLAFSQSALIAELGRAGMAAVMLAVAAVLVTHPAIFATLARMGRAERLFAPPRGRPPAVLQLRALPGLGARAPVAVTLAALGALAVAAAMYAQIEPRFYLFGDLRDDDRGLQALHEIDARLFPTGSLHVPVQVDSLEDLGAAHAIVAGIAGEANVYSLASVGPGIADATAMAERLSRIPEPLAQRLVSADRDAAVITVLYPYRDSLDTQQRTLALESRLDAANPPPGVDFGAVTGITVMASFVSHEVLVHLNLSFLIAVFAATGLIGLWLRRVLPALAALLPNLLPIACVAGWLSVSGAGLDFAGALALTIAFGLAVDDTVHVLNRLRLTGGLDTPHDAAAVREATQDVSSALVITSLVLTLAMSGTLFAELESVTTFGLLSVSVFVLALLADLLVLPACLISLGRMKQSYLRRSEA